MALTLTEALENPIVLQALKENPKSFRFQEAPSLLISMVSWPTHTRIYEEDYNSKPVLEGIPTNFPFEGPMSHMLEILSTSLNFTYKQVVPPDKSWGVRADNGTWSGMMRQVVKKEVDLGLGPFTVISSRLEDADMSIPFFFDKLAMLVGRGSAAIDPWSFAMPFTPVLWGILFVTMMGICLFHMLLESPHHPRTNRLRLFGGILFEYLQPPLEIGIIRTAWRSWHRPLMGSWMIFTLLMTSSYLGSLKSMMALRHVPHPIQTVRDLVESASVKIIIEHRTAFIDAFQKVSFGDIMQLNEAGEGGRYVDYRMSDFMLYKDLVRRGDHVQIFDTLTALKYSAQDFTLTGKCNFYLARETFIPTMYGMVGQKRSPLTPALDARIRRVIEAGLYNYWARDMVTNITSCAHSPTKVTSMDPIGIGNIWGLAVVWSIGMSIAATVLALEFCLDKI